MKQVEAILRPLSDALAVDGALLRVVDIQGPVLRLSLDTVGADCPECLVGDETVEAMVLARLAAAEDAPAIERVEIDHASA